MRTGLPLPSRRSRNPPAFNPRSKAESDSNPTKTIGQRRKDARGRDAAASDGGEVCRSRSATGRLSSPSSLNSWLEGSAPHPSVLSRLPQSDNHGVALFLRIDVHSGLRPVPASKQTHSPTD